MDAVLSSTTALVSFSILTTLTAITVSRLIFRGDEVKVIKSPAATLLPKLSLTEIAALPYPPDALPGGRDVESPYGTVRVFEWGPEHGRKVLLVHGITTPGLALGAVAHGLVERGCRVMIFDAWGRGYSDAPADLVYDERLYATQILLAVTSSPLSWTGGLNGGFSVIGYSLGGGISICFTSYFQNMVKSLVLLTPTSLIRDSRLGVQKYFPILFSIIPEPILEVLLKKRLQRPMFPKENRESVATAEVTPNEAILKEPPPSLKYPDVTVFAATQWNIQTHPGFIRSFTSVARFGPAAGQHAAWRRLLQKKRKILIIVASHDPIIVTEELKPDVEEVVRDSGTDIVWREIDGAHDIPTTDPDKIVRDICAFWEM
ncbi:alpha/beta-hydrolase [Mollisia scopiformis]|uniref:Alpha/beta-hydrolase n=1 Tax=Mollisia scopiformis TaxID=149040 RepID=A0A132BF18_MOLSC|nr:alpha/beta-hydrolase [Mollisia scopiformis]KUJ10464.1 alpha/beta-hydrolase [Mollisia scopiformis]